MTEEVINNTPNFLNNKAKKNRISEEKLDLKEFETYLLFLREHGLLKQAEE